MNTIPRKLLNAALFSCAVVGALTSKSWAAETTNDLVAPQPTTRLACIGDSITYGAGVSNRETLSYPAQLAGWLGPKWEVGNFGASGSTLLKKGNLPYWQRPHFRNALTFKPDVAVIMLGTNDSKHGAPDNPKIADNWQHKAEFTDDYQALLNEFRQVNPQIKLFVGLPVPAFAPNRYGIDGTIIEREIVPLTRQVAVQTKTSIIDLQAALYGKPELFHDRVHPNDAGAKLIATTVYRALTGQEPPAAPQPLDNVGETTTVATTALAALPTDTPASPTLPSPTVAIPSNKENFHIYLLMGQSNMVGRDTRDLAMPNNPNLLALNKEGQWEIAKDPLHFQEGRIAPGVGPGITFALEMLKADPKVTIGLVPCAVGGTSLGRWVKGSDLYENAVNRARLAAQTGIIKGVLWHQGESDTTFPKKAEVYEKRASGMFNDLRNDLGQPNLPIVVGQIGEFLTTEKYAYVEGIRAALRTLPQNVPHVGFADSTGLVDKGDKLHFDAKSEKEMGVRFAKAMLQLQRKP